MGGGEGGPVCEVFCDSKNFVFCVWKRGICLQDRPGLISYPVLGFIYERKESL